MIRRRVLRALVLPFFFLPTAVPAAQPERLDELSTRHHEWATAVSGDGATLCYSVADPNFVSVTRAWTILCSERWDDGWDRPRVAPFSGLTSDAYPAFSVDGTRLYFASDRPGGSRDPHRRDFDLWVVERSPDGTWGTPRHLPHASSGFEELRPWPSERGLYFTSDRPGGAGGMDLWRVDLRPEAEPLPLDSINTPGTEVDPWVDARETRLLFASSRPGGAGGLDLYASQRRDDGSWDEPVGVDGANSPAHEDTPSLFADRLFFASRRGFADAAPERRLDAASIRRALGAVDNGASNLYQLSVAPQDLPWPPPPAPALRPRLIGPGVVSTELFEGHPELSPDGRELYFTVYARNWRYNAIFVSRRTELGWSEPEVAPFSGRHADSTTGISPDGRWLYFVSKRPRQAGAAAAEDFDLWRLARRSAGWGEPERLPEPINSDAREFCPSVAADGTLYFMSRRSAGHGRGDLYRVRPTNGGWGTVTNLGPPINTEHEEGNVYVTPDQSLLLFMADRPDGDGGDDVYLARRLDDGSWGPPRRLPAPINGRDNDFSPKLAADGHTLLFASNRFDRTSPVLSYEALTRRLDGVLNGASNLFEVDISALLQE